MDTNISNRLYGTQNSTLNPSFVEYNTNEQNCQHIYSIGRKIFLLTFRPKPPRTDLSIGGFV
jgi:hypothetical protein